MCIVIALCYLASYRLDSNIIAPSPTVVFKEFCALFMRADFFICVFSTLWRATYGYALAFLAALVLATAANASKVVEKLLYPITAIVRAVPTMAVILLCLTFLRSKKTPVAVSLIITFPMLYSAIFGVLSSRDKKISEMIKVYGVPADKVFFKYLFPDTVYRLFPQFVTTFSFNVKLTVSGEAMAWTKDSIGASMMIAKSNVETAVLLAWALVTIILSFIIELGLKGLAALFIKIKKECNVHRNKKTI